jgi:hypothetical protein
MMLKVKKNKGLCSFVYSVVTVINLGNFKGYRVFHAAFALFLVTKTSMLHNVTILNKIFIP